MTSAAAASVMKGNATRVRFVLFLLPFHLLSLWGCGDAEAQTRGTVTLNERLFRRIRG